MSDLLHCPPCGASYVASAVPEHRCPACGGIVYARPDLRTAHELNADFGARLHALAASALASKDPEQMRSTLELIVLSTAWAHEGRSKSALGVVR